MERKNMFAFTFSRSKQEAKAGDVTGPFRRPIQTTSSSQFTLVVHVDHSFGSVWLLLDNISNKLTFDLDISHCGSPFKFKVYSQSQEERKFTAANISRYARMLQAETKTRSNKNQSRIWNCK